MDLERSAEKGFPPYGEPRRSLLPRAISLFVPALSAKRFCLVLLVLQNSALITTMHYSRVYPVADGGRRYFPSTAIVLVEVIKLLASLCIATYDAWDVPASQPASQLLGRLAQAVFSRDGWKLAVPAALWTLQNSLIFVAVANLDPPTFQVLYQLKILTTVLFSILLLRRSVAPRQWLALLLLAAGVAVVQTDAPLVALSSLAADAHARLVVLLAPPPISSPANTALPPSDQHAMDTSLGLAAVAGASVISGLTGVYFEAIVISPSSSPATLWTRNIQLSFFSLIPAVLGGVLWQDGQAISRAGGFFAGYGGLAWATVGLQALGGIVVAVCIARAGNIAKNFAASISIVCSAMVSVLLFGMPLTVGSTTGTALVLLAVYLYHGADGR